VIVRRRFLALVAAIGLACVGSLVLIERATRPAAGGSSVSTQRPAAPLGPPAGASPSPSRVRREPAGTTPSAPGPVAARAEPSARARGPAPVAVAGGGPRVEFSFKLDPRLTSGVHMGTRWVSPRTYTRTGHSKTVTVEARARVVGGAPPRSPAKVAWAASEPDMVEVSPERGQEVKLTIWRPGESRVTVDAGAASGTLTVRAAEVRGSLRVDIVR
jgi:hypothetical protein